MKKFKSLVEMCERVGILKESLVEERDNMEIHILGEFGAMMAERGYERAQKDFGVDDA